MKTMSNNQTWWPGTDNQTCAACGKPCRPGAGIAEDDGRRHIKCPDADPQKLARRQLAMAKVNSARWHRSRTQGAGIRANPGGTQ